MSECVSVFVCVCVCVCVCVGSQESAVESRLRLKRFPLPAETEPGALI